MSDPSPEPVVAPPPTTSTRSGRSVRFPGRYRDFLPVTRTALAHIPSKENQNPPQAIADPISHPQGDSLGLTSPAPDMEDSGSQAMGDESPPGHLEALTTNANSFGIYRVYSRKPVHDCSMCLSPNTRCDVHHAHGDTQALGQHSGIQATPYYHPFSNPSAAAMMVAHHSGTHTLSGQQTTRIARILGSLGSDLNHLDLCDFDAALENKRLDAYLASVPESTFLREDGWKKSSARIRLPLDKTKMLESDAAEFEVGGIFHRDIIDVITMVYQSDAVKTFNHIPFKEFWRPSENAPPERLYGEIFSSQEVLDADDEICKWCLDNDLDSGLEAITVPLLLYSDSTHLASFGTASCWPVYMFFGSQSKYIRAMPTSSACHHIAYLPSVPDHIQDIYQAHYNTSATAATLTHCKRELIHAVFSLILDDRFVDAYRNGIVIECGDGHRRRLFPRIVMHSADYPEK
jgi:hypothetical protein